MVAISYYSIRQTDRQDAICPFDINPANKAEDSADHRLAQLTWLIQCGTHIPQTLPFAILFLLCDADLLQALLFNSDS